MIEQERSLRSHSRHGRVAVITGASSGIGRAIAVALAHEGAHVHLVGRSSAALAETIALAGKHSGATELQADLRFDSDFDRITSQLSRLAAIDILIHSAGIIHQKRMEDATIEEFDAQYSTNVRAPYLLTKRLLPMLIAARGQVVFMNSTAGLAAARADVGQYAASKHALRAVADSLREELNPQGVRVLSLYIGRTASPMQERLFREEGKTYHPETLLQPEDVASVVLHALLLPETAEITDLTIRPMMNPIR
jgi:NADP-dependent 3-hydroxy acid dehydrogenase YdfG